MLSDLTAWFDLDFVTLLSLSENMWTPVAAPYWDDVPPICMVISRDQLVRTCSFYFHTVLRLDLILSSL